MWLVVGGTGSTFVYPTTYAGTANYHELARCSFGVPCGLSTRSTNNTSMVIVLLIHIAWTRSNRSEDSRSGRKR